MDRRFQAGGGQGRSTRSEPIENDASEVNWNDIENELESTNSVWKDLHFDSLPHVVEVLTSRDPQGALRSLRRRRDAIEELVDDVVQGYHSGFNRAIHNYSRILRLFSESAAQMSGLKTNLGESRRLLSARHKQLQQLFYRSITLRHIISLLDQIDNVAKVPARVEKMIAEKKYYAAVQTLLHSIGLIEREGIQGVGALREVRNELVALRQKLFQKVVDDLQHHLYNKGTYSIKDHDRTEHDDDISTIVIAPVPASVTGYASVGPAGGKIEKTSRAKPRSMRRTPSEARSLSIDTSSQSMEDRELDDNPGTPSSEVSGSSSRQELVPDFIARRLSQQQLPPWLAETTPDSFTEAISKSDAPLLVKYLQTLVEILFMLGRIAAAGSILSQKLRGAVRERIVAEIKAKAAKLDSTRPRMEKGSNTLGFASSLSLPRSLSTPRKTRAEDASNPHHGSNGNSIKPPAGAHMRDGAAALVASPMHAAQVAAHDLLESIMQMLLQVLENHVCVCELIDKKVANVATQGSRGVSLQEQDIALNAPTGGYSMAFAWSCIQSEVQQLICDILRATPDSATTDGAASRIQNLHISNGTSSVAELTFSFRFSEHAHPVAGAGESLSSTLGVDGTFHNSKKRGTTLAQEGYGTAAVLSERGIYLTSACYRPVLQFTDKVCQVLPPKYAELGRLGLRPFIDNAVLDQFLPGMHADYRSRVAEALSSPAAFRPKGKKVKGPYETSQEKSRLMLQGPLVVEQLVGEVLLWAQAMPVYAGEFVHLIHTLLERTLERCRAVYTEAVLGSVSSGPVGSPELEHLMKQQRHLAVLLEEGEPSEKELQEAAEVPLPDSDEYDIEMKIHHLLFQLRPLKEEQLILDTQKLLLLGALSDTLDHLGDSINLLGQAQLSNVGKKKIQRRNSNAAPLSSGLAALASRCRSLSRECLRTLRLEMQLQCVFHLQAMHGKSYICENDAEDPEDFIVAITSQMTRMNEELSIYLSPARRCYVLGGVCGLAATGLIGGLSGVEGVNLLGVRQIQRNRQQLQQSLATLGANSISSIQMCLDRVNEYYDLLKRPYEALVAYIGDHDHYYSYNEYMALVKAKVPGRDVPPDAAAKVGKFLTS